MTTTLQLSILMAAYTGSDEMDTFKRNTPTYQSQVMELERAGMIESSSEMPPLYTWRLTSKGKYWYEYILNVPFPVSVEEWRIPNDDD